MTLTLNTHIPSFTQLPAFRSQTATISEISIVFTFPIEKPTLQNLTLL